MGVRLEKNQSARGRYRAHSHSDFCAQEETRTLMPLRAPPPQDGTSANFATWACKQM